jgi:hypothetical protein
MSIFVNDLLSYQGKLKEGLKSIDSNPSGDKHPFMRSREDACVLSQSQKDYLTERMIWIIIAR